jgi:hypothetical protein
MQKVSRKKRKKNPVLVGVAALKHTTRAKNKAQT